MPASDELENVKRAINRLNTTAGDGVEAAWRSGDGEVLIRLMVPRYVRVERP